MGTTKLELARALGVSKGTVTNYIDRLGLGSHVTRSGNTDVLDDEAASALAAAIGTEKAPKEDEGSRAPATLAEAQQARIDKLTVDLYEERRRHEERVAGLEAELAAARARADEAADRLLAATEANARLSDQMAELARRQQAIAATPWWRRWQLAAKLLGPAE